MKIGDIRLFRFDLPLAEPLKVGGIRLLRRCGAVVALVDDDGQYHAGEVSPLPGYCSESLEEVTAQLLRLKWSLVGTELPQSIEELSGAMASWLGSGGYAPSVRFGVESAALGMLAAERSMNLSRLLCDQPVSSIAVNALLGLGSDDPTDQLRRRRDEGFRAYKLKVGRRTVREDIATVNRLLEVLRENESLRLDANRAWSFNDAVRFCQEVDLARIEYVEEPLVESTDPAGLVQACPALPLALDETLRSIQPSDLPQFAGLRAIVLKPTVLGCERAMQFARVASRQGLQVVMSSTFETSLGLTAIAHLAAAAGSPPAVSGLDTVRWLAEDLTRESIRIKDGSINIASLPGGQTIDWHRCEEIDGE
ncbi:MAG: o-succinylbenzoate synthase [bacterium]